jgi:importin-5
LAVLCVARVADAHTDDNWPEILGVLFNLSVAPDAGKRETAYRVFATTPGIIEKQHENSVIEAFQRGFKDDAVGVSSVIGSPC